MQTFVVAQQLQNKNKDEPTPHPNTVSYTDDDGHKWTDKELLTGEKDAANSKTPQKNNEKSYREVQINHRINLKKIF